MLTLLIFLLSFDFVLDQVLDFFNFRHSKKALPTELQAVYTDEEYQKSQSYQSANYYFGLITSTLSFGFSLLLFTSGALGKLSIVLRENFQHPIVFALVFFGILFIAIDLLGLPASIYHTFVLEEKYGFNKTTASTFVTDKIKGWLLTCLIGGLLLGTLLFLILKLGSNFWIYFWIFTSLFLVLVNLFYTSVIVPLFNKLTPLEEGSLKEKITEYSHSVGFDLKNIYVVDGSKRSSKANAYFSGFGRNKKVVLFDTLIKNHSEEELVAVLAHEIGHYKKKHILMGLAISILQTGAILFILSLFINNEYLSLALGETNNSIPLNLIAFSILFSPISELIGIATNKLSRVNEYQADDFAATTYKPEPLMIALKKLSTHNLSNLNPHPAYVFVHYSHPPLLLRLKNLEKHV